MTHRTVRLIASLLVLTLALPVVAERKNRKKNKAAALGGIASALAKDAAQPVQTVMVPMRDGLKLATDVVLPVGEGKKWPTVLMRTPYGRAGGGGLATAGAIVTKFGYAVVSQDMRGRGDSEGEDYPVFASCGWGELQDGYDTIEWIAKQPWSDGKIAQFGASALGISANATAPARPPHLTCQFVIVAASDIYTQGATWNGTPRKSLSEMWVKGTKLDPRNLVLWKQHPDYDDFWKQYCPELVADRVNIPVCYVGGWYDIFSQGTINSFVMIQNKGDKGARGNCRLVMGPWAHGDFSTDEIKYPSNANMRAQVPLLLGWFNKWCKGIDLDKDAKAVRYYVMGASGEEGAPGNEWRDVDQWPLPSKDLCYYFHKGGLLSPEKPTEAKASATYEFDPNNPVPTIGGGNLKLKKGPMDQREAEKRKDVVLFTTPVLAEPVEVTGRVKVKLWAKSDCRDTDFTAKLTDVYPDGRSMLVLDGIVSARYRESMSDPKMMTPGRIYEFEIDLWSTSIIFNKGHRIRVAVSSSNFPRFEANPNTGKPRDDQGQVKVAKNTICFDEKHPSHVIFPQPLPATAAKAQ
ncbi:MAG: CocE/NonD family hydrolase [Phycisphaerae bacterium]|nr:CocE/NonD family hydrolase [Phycisphaerae bacterium]